MKVKITILRDIVPPGWTSKFHVRTAEFRYDARRPLRLKIHQLIFQQGAHYGEVGDMCAGFTHAELLDLEERGFVQIDGMRRAS